MPHGRGPTSTDPAAIFVRVSTVNTRCPRPVLTYSFVAFGESSTVIGLMPPGLPSDIGLVKKFDQIGAFLSGELDLLVEIRIGVAAPRAKIDDALERFQAAIVHVRHPGNRLLKSFDRSAS